MPKQAFPVQTSRQNSFGDRVATGLREGLVRPLRLMLALFLFLLFLPRSPSLAEEQSASPGSSCPSREEILIELANMVRNLQKIKIGLNDVLSGRESVEQPLEVLLLVDLQDKAAMQRRREELQVAIRKPRSESQQALDPMLQCALNDKNLHDSAMKFLDLRRQVDRLRLRLLQYPADQIKRIVDLQTQAREGRAGLAGRLNKARSQTLTFLAEARLQLKIAEYMAMNAASHDLRALATERALLEKSKIDLATAQLQWIAEIGKREKFYRDLVERLLEVAGKSLTSLPAEAIKDGLSGLGDQSIRVASLEVLKKDYRDTVKFWRALIDKAYRTSFGSVYQLNIPVLAQFPKDLMDRLGNIPKTKEYRDSLTEAIQARADFWQLNAEVSSKESDALYRLLLVSGKLRAQLLHELLQRGDQSPVAITDANLQDLVRELRIVPYRWTAILTVKTLDIRDYLRMGIEGILKLARDLFRFLVFLCLLVLCWLGIGKMVVGLDHMRRALIRGRHVSAAARRLALWIQRLLPYVPWLVLLPAVAISKRLIATSVFAELGILLPYIQIYSIYRIIMLLVKDVLSSISRQLEEARFKAIQGKIQRSARVLGLLFLVSQSLLYAVESIVSQALAYLLAVNLFLFTGLVVCAWVANQWRQELAEFIDRSTANTIARRASKGCTGKLSLLWSLPALAVAVALRMRQVLESWGEEFELYKKVSARIFKHKLEIRASRELSDLKRDLFEHYACWFKANGCEDASVLVVPQDDLVAQLKETIEQWCAGNVEEQSAAIHGQKGSGKSWLLKRLAGELQNLRVLRVSVWPKLLNRTGVLTFFEDLLQVSLKNGSTSLEEADKTMPKTLVLIDEAQNLFLAKLGGFEGYRMFVDLVNARTRNLFWCAAFNDFSWHYLNSVLGVKRSFDLVKKVPRWSEQDIKNLIQTRHRKTVYRISYDGIINAASIGDRLDSVAHAESNFFRLLWQQSNGNPEAALYLWLSSLTPVEAHRLWVGLPEDPGMGWFARLLEEELFVYAEIVRHGELSVEDLQAVTNLPESLVRKVLREGIERQSLNKSVDGLYQIRIAQQNALMLFLEGKNFIYGS